jgi:hypothetical protein
VTAIIIQPQFVALGTWRLDNGKQVPVTITTEWRRPLEQLAQAQNATDEAIAALTARVAALEAE